MHHEIDKYHEHISAFPVIIKLINSHLENYSEVNSVGFSLSRRDGDSNRLLPSWGQIPNHKPRLQSQCSHGSPLGLFGVRIAGVPGAASSGTNRSARSLKQCLPLEINFVSPHILPSSRRRANRARAGPTQTYRLRGSRPRGTN